MFGLFMFIVVLACWLLSKTDDAAHNIRNKERAKECNDTTYYDHNGRLRMVSNNRLVVMFNGSIVDANTKEVYYDKVEEAVKEANRQCSREKLDCYVKIVKIDRYAFIAKDNKQRMAILVDKKTSKPFWIAWDGSDYYRYDYHSDNNISNRGVVVKKKLIRFEPDKYGATVTKIDYEIAKKYTSIVLSVESINTMIENTGF